MHFMQRTAMLRSRSLKRSDKKFDYSTHVCNSAPIEKLVDVNEDNQPSEPDRHLISSFIASIPIYVVSVFDFPSAVTYKGTARLFMI